MAMTALFRSSIHLLTHGVGLYRKDNLVIFKPLALELCVAGRGRTSPVFKVKGQLVTLDGGRGKPDDAYYWDCAY